MMMNNVTVSPSGVDWEYSVAATPNAAASITVRWVKHVHVFTLCQENDGDQPHHLSFWC